MSKKSKKGQTKNNQDVKRLYYVGIGIAILTVVTDFFPGLDEPHILYLDAAWFAILVTITGVVIAKTLSNKTDQKIEKLEGKIDAISSKLDILIKGSEGNKDDLSKRVKLDHE